MTVMAKKGEGIAMRSSAQTIDRRQSNFEVRRCVRCVMPESYPGVTFDSYGVCSFCRYFDKQWGSWVAREEERARSEARLQRIFEAAKRKRRPYDALLGISGGKDSSYMLYLCHKVYGLRVLTFTRDNGFMDEEAKDRVDKLVKTFNVPHLYCWEPLAAELAGVFIRKTGNFCAPCELLSFNAHAVLAREFNIPLIILGSSSRTEAPPPKSLNPWDPWYFRNVLKAEPYRERLHCSFYGRNYLLGEGLARVLGRRRILLLPDYVDWDEDKIFELFKRDFGFDFGKEHSDCWATSVAGHLYRKKCGGNDPRVGKYSLLIRGGKMTREEALERLGNMQDNHLPPPNLDRFLQSVGMNREEFEAASELSPDPYLTGLPRLFNILRRIVRRQAA
jgi:hypothetical protein